MIRGTDMAGLRKAAITVLLGWTLAVTISRAVRFANDFAEAHWLLDYRFGFLRRALPGEVLNRLVTLTGQPLTEPLIRVVTVSVFTLFGAALFTVALRSVQRSRWSPANAIVAAAFMSSPFVVMSAHFLGYFDQLVMLAAIASIALALRGWWWTSAAVQALSVLVHEASIVIAFPAWCLTWLLRADMTAPRARRAQQLVPLAIPLAVFLAVSYGTARIDTPTFVRDATRHLSGYPFVQQNMSGMVPIWLAESFGTYSRQSHRFAERVAAPRLHGLMVPIMVALLAASLDIFRPVRAAPAMALAGVAVAPLIMHMSGWDTERIWSHAIATCFLGWWVVSEARTPGPASPAIRVLGVSALISGVLLVSPLMDDQADRYSLVERLLLYAPSLAAALALLALPEPAADSHPH